MNFNEFKMDLPKTIKVYDQGQQRNLLLTLSNDRQRYVSGNMGTPKRRVFHCWSLESAFNNRITKDHKEKIKSMKVGIN